MLSTAVRSAPDWGTGFGVKVEEQRRLVDVLSIAFYVIVLAAALGLSYWAGRARTDRSAIVGLYLVFGMPGLLLAIWGVASIIRTDHSTGPVYLALGLALTLPLIRSIRRVLARVMPLDPDSPIDMVGLCLILAGCAWFLSYLVDIGSSPRDLEIEPVGLADLALTAVFEL